MPQHINCRPFSKIQDAASTGEDNDEQKSCDKLFKSSIYNVMDMLGECFLIQLVLIPYQRVQIFLLINWSWHVEIQGYQVLPHHILANSKNHFYSEKVKYTNAIEIKDILFWLNKYLM
jgi:hypothetical protein